PTGYFIDSLFRKPAGAAPTPAAAAGTNQSPAASTSEVSRIFLNSIRTGALPQDDARYVAQLVAERTGLSQQEAEKRVNDTYAKAQATLKEAEAKAKSAAEAARKAAAYGSLWLVISMLLGAFIASLAATWGGRQRDL
ncbi:MAG: hypothetical protein ABIW85_06955, partial [Variovorax sp.]